MRIFDINTMSNDEIVTEMQRAKEGSKNHFNFRHRLASGEVRDVEVSSNPIPIEGHTLLYSIIHDVTERIQAEKQYRYLFERTGTGMAVLEADGTLSLVNSTFARMAEGDESEIIGHSFLEGVAESDKVRMQEYHQKRLHGEGAPEHYEFQFKTLKGNDGCALLNLSLFPDSGRTLASVIDITKRKRAEEALLTSEKQSSALLEAIPDLIFRMNGQGVILYYNAQEEKLFVPPSAINPETSIRDLLPAEVAVLFSQNIIKTLETGEMQTFEYRLDMPERGMVVYEARMVQSGDDEVTAIVRDINERNRMQELMLQTEKMMSVGRLAAGMAHELNNPIGGIAQGLQNINRRLLPDFDKNIEVARELNLDLGAMQEYLSRRGISGFIDQMTKACTRSSDIVNNMLSFSHKPASASPQNIKNIVESTLLLANINFEPHWQYDFKNIEVVRQYDESVGEIPCIAPDIQQVLLNIFKNAAQGFVEVGQFEDSARITIRIFKKKRYACIEIEDNGPGMDEDTRKRVFEPFFTKRRVGEGTGLGMAVSYFIVTQEHSGTISVESSPGNGAIFKICLPSKQ